MDAEKQAQEAHNQPSQAPEAKKTKITFEEYKRIANIIVFIMKEYERDG